MTIRNFEEWVAKNDKGSAEKDSVPGIYQTFYDEMKGRGLADNSIDSNLRNLKTMRTLASDIDFMHLTKKDIKRLQTLIMNKYENIGSSNLVKLSLRKWIIYTDQNKDPTLLEAVNLVSGRGKEKLPEEMVTKQELEALLNHCTHPRDAAMIALLYDSGGRIGEILGMAIENVAFDDLGAVVTFPTGKTGARMNRVVFASSYLRNLVESHEFKNNPKAALFYSFRTKVDDGKRDCVAMSYEGARSMINMVAERAGIKRRLHPHLFRHTRATELANHLTEQQLKRQFGWKAGSNMAARYVHLTDKDTEKAVLRASGVHVEEAQNRTKEALKCGRCKEINAPHAEFCFKCGYPLSAGAIAKMEDDRRKDQDELAEMRKQLKEMQMAIGLLQVINVAKEKGLVTDEDFIDDDSIEEVNKGVGMTPAELDEYKRQLAEDAMEEQKQAPKPSRKQKQAN